MLRLAAWPLPRFLQNATQVCQHANVALLGRRAQCATVLRGCVISQYDIRVLGDEGACCVVHGIAHDQGRRALGRARNVQWTSHGKEPSRVVDGMHAIRIGEHAGSLVERESSSSQLSHNAFTTP